MVFFLPMEFMSPTDHEATEAEQEMAQLALEPMLATFEKSEDEKRRHLKALFLKGQVDGRPVTKLLVDGGAAVNIMSYAMFRKLGRDDVLRRFTNSAGEFSLAPSKDIVGLLSLHDMSHLDIGEEASLYKAKVFSSKHLASAIRYLEPGLARYVRHSLHPYHLSLMQYKARHHLSYLQSLPSKKCATAMQELAIAEFHLNKLLHQKEMEEVKSCMRSCYKALYKAPGTRGLREDAAVMKL
ncbi:S-(+)-linalool synthase, chloroplastic-like [Setaria italica]|uniref:S-(+)-linalool synthase, chloroplastic-like n=1 Tax=Setaria italica TaxID=4555 RepID=UPI000BE5B5B2|nr:S-(+)-linalool synthase, chloroplastic-like [Setaria italica]